MVDPLEIEQLHQCLANADIRKHGTASVEHQEFRRLGHPGLDSVPDHLASSGCRKIVALMPAQRFSFDTKVIKAALERFEVAVRFPIKVEPDLVEVPQSPINRQVAAPVV